jgi:hypothetical protein
MKFVISILFLVSFSTVHAQTDSTKFGFLPALGYTSDLGLLGGGIFNRFHYKDGYRPYINMQMVSAIVSTKGFYSIYLLHERTSKGTSTSLTSIRSTYEVYSDRTTESTWFGLGPDSHFRKDEFEGDINFFKSASSGFIYRGRLPLYRTGFPGAQLDAVLIGQFGYNKPFDRNPNQSFWQDLPNGTDGGWSTGAGLGLQWENRDAEIAPIRGNTAIVEARYLPRILPDSYSAFLVLAEATQYVPIRIGHLFVIAGRIGMQHASGDVPYWFMPAIGGDQTVRGLPMNRYRGDGALWYNSEIRTWVYENRNEAIKVGMHVFRDGGGVVVNHDYATIPENLVHTWGVGFALSLFTPDFLVRGDFGFSEDVSRFYMGIGYTF